MEIDRYCARNLQEREERVEAERRRQHEVQHAQLVGSGEETSQFTAGENTKEEEEEEKEVDPSLVGSLDDVYTDEPGAMMTEDPFQRMPVMDDKEKPASLMEMEKSLDALVYTNEENMDSSDLDVSSLDRGVRTKRPVRDNHLSANPHEEEQSHDERAVVQPPESLEEDSLPDVVGALSTGEQLGSENPGLPSTLPDVQPAAVSRSPGPDVAAGFPTPSSLPLDLAVGAQQAVDLVDQASQAMGGEPPSSQPVDLTDGLLQLNVSAHT